MAGTSFDQPNPSEPHAQEIKKGLVFIYTSAPIIYEALAKHPQLVDQETGRVLIHRFITEPEVHIEQGDVEIPSHLYHETNTYIGRPEKGMVDIWEENIVGEAKHEIEGGAVEVEDLVAEGILKGEQSQSPDESPFANILEEISKSSVKRKRKSMVRFKLTADGVAQGKIFRQAFAEPEIETMMQNHPQNPFKETEYGIGSAELESRVKNFKRLFLDIMDKQKLTPKDLLERFFMPLIYKPDQAWARAMQNSVASGVNLLQNNDKASFDDLITVLVDTARAGLAERAVSYQGSEEEIIKIRSHAENFGILRKGSQRVSSIRDTGPMSVFKDEAVETLKKFGTHSQEDGVWGQFSPKRRQPFKQERYTLQHSYETPDGPVKLCTVNSSWIPTHDDEWVRVPFRTVDITSPTVDVIPPMFKAANVILDQMKDLKKQIDFGIISRDETNLNKITGHASEIYWMISQTWPYERGSAGVADLATKVIFDWLNIHTPSWKDDANPNTLALLKPLKEFQKGYPLLYKEPLTWK